MSTGRSTIRGTKFSRSWRATGSILAQPEGRCWRISALAILNGNQSPRSKLASMCGTKVVSATLKAMPTNSRTCPTTSSLPKRRRARPMPISGMGTTGRLSVSPIPMGLCEASMPQPRRGTGLQVFGNNSFGLGLPTRIPVPRRVSRSCYWNGRLGRFRLSPRPLHRGLTTTQRACPMISCGLFGTGSPTPRWSKPRRPRMRDLFNDAINAPAGRLAEILLRKIPAGDVESNGALLARFDKLVDAPGKPGLFARVRFAADVPFLFARAPNWTRRKLLPHFEWSSPDAADVWSARKYSNGIGSPELFGLLKKSFLELFGRNDVSTEDLDTFAEWLAAILTVNPAEDAGYPLTPTEARSALRRAGAKALSSVGHRLATEMESAKPEDRVELWRTVVGPVFQAIWPLDVELQTSASTFKLVQILRGSGEAFPEAAGVIIPFIRPEDPRSLTTVYSIAEASDSLYTAAPGKMLDLLTAVVGEPLSGSVYGLDKALSRLRSIDPNLADTRKFQKLLNYASQHG